MVEPVAFFYDHWFRLKKIPNLSASRLRYISLLISNSIHLTCSMFDKIARIKLLASLYLFIITVLFLLPGSALPKDDMFFPHFDKVVHFSFFAVLLFLWHCQYASSWRISLLLLLVAFVYGLGVEVIQHYLIVNRSFDAGDVVADMTGAIVGVAVWRYIKK